MSKFAYIINGLLLIVVAGLLLLNFLNKKDYRSAVKRYNTEISTLEDSIESNQAEMKLYLDSIKTIKKRQNKFEKQATEYKKQLDELSDKECPKKLKTYKKQAKSLNSALAACKKTQSLYTKTYGVCTTMSDNYNGVVIKQEDIIKINKKAKRRNAIKWTVTAAGAVLVLVIAVII